MKTMKTIMLLAIILFAGITANAQTAVNTPIEDFFIGKWTLNVTGLPQGDAIMLLIIEKKDGQLCGSLGGEHGESPNKLTKVEIKDKTLNVRFMGGGWDVPMYLDKKDDKSVTGSMNDMFDVEGTKVIEVVK